MSLIIDAQKQKVTKVKNLGWLLRHADDVERFRVLNIDDPQEGECFLLAELTDGRVYLTTWQSRTVLREWLNRRVFRGIPGVTALRYDVAK